MFLFCLFDHILDLEKLLLRVAATGREAERERREKEEEEEAQPKAKQEISEKHPDAQS